MLKKVMTCAMSVAILSCSGADTPAVDDPLEAAAADELRIISPRARRRICRQFNLSNSTRRPAFCGGIEGNLSAELAEACPDNQWIGLRFNNAACPVPPTTRTGSWQVSAPLERATAPILQRFCLYRWEPSVAGARPDTSVLPNQSSIRLERDCEVVGTNNFIPADGAWQELERGFDAQVDLPEWNAPVATAVPVRIAVIDTSPDSDPTDTLPFTGEYRHGREVGTIARRLSCTRTAAGEDQCAEIKMYLGLPRLTTEEYGVRGGYYGSQFELSAAIFRAVFDWEINPASPQNLIINLSVGWDSVYGGRPRPGMRLSEAVAWLTAQYAACKGALLVASAGNRTISGNSGPMFPGAWERSPKLCADGPPNAYNPLVHSVGGVDGIDQPLASTRIDGTPRLVAPGSVVSVERANFPDNPTAVFSGSSMSAAAVTGAAGLVWALRPNLPPWRVMQIVYQSSRPLGAQADYGLFGVTLGQRRLSTCGAARSACTIAPCPQPNACIDRLARQDARPDFGVVISSQYPNAEDFDGGFMGETVPEDGQDIWDKPWVGPQPGTPVCPLCGILTTEDKLIGQLNPDLTFDKLTLRVNVKFEDQMEVPIDLPAEEPFAVQLPQEILGLELKNATLEGVTVTDGKEVVRSSELFIE